MPDGRMRFDERGIAVDGELEHDGVRVDLRAAGMVAVLVSRVAIAPDALYTDDDAVRRRVLAGLRAARWLRWLRLAAPALWVAVLAVGIVSYLEHHEPLWDAIVGPGAILVTYAATWWYDRWRIQRAAARAES